MNRNTLRSFAVPILLAVSLLALPAGPAWAAPANPELVAAAGSGPGSSLSNWLSRLLDWATAGWFSEADDQAGRAGAEKASVIQLQPPPGLITNNPNGGGGGGGDQGDHGPGVDPNG
jgi:hypothetical protein